MEDIMLSKEGVIRLSAFLGVFAIMASYEAIARKRKLSAPKAKRWLINLGITFLNTAILRLVFATGAMGTAIWAASRGWGIFNGMGLPPILEGLIGHRRDHRGKVPSCGDTSVHVDQDSCGDGHGRPGMERGGLRGSA
jgi:hypothetical protein